MPETNLQKRGENNMKQQHVRVTQHENINPNIYTLAKTHVPQHKFFHRVDIGAYRQVR